MAMRKMAMSRIAQRREDAGKGVMDAGNVYVDSFESKCYTSVYL